MGRRKRLHRAPLEVVGVIVIVVVVVMCLLLEVVFFLLLPERRRSEGINVRRYGASGANPLGSERTLTANTEPLLTQPV